MTIVIAGSGPAGAFAALGALQAGNTVLMIDPGLTPEPQARMLKERLAAKDWSTWTTEDYASLGATPDAARAQLHHKRVFRSDFATRPLHRATITEKQCKITRSYAQGGLSNVWGRGIEPPFTGECEHWGFKEDFLHSLASVASYLPFSGGNDNLAQVMPLYTDDFTLLPLTQNAEALLERWQRYSDTLNSQGIYFGRTRLALRHDHSLHSCRLCHMCFYGCAYDAQFTTNEMIASFQASYPQFSYRPGLLVKRFTPSAGEGVEIIVEHINGKTEETLQAEKLILATGAAETTAIVMRSLNLGQAALKNSDVIRIPFLKIPGKFLAEKDTYHSLSQLTLAINKRSISKKAVILHLFGYNPLIRDALLSVFPKQLQPALTAFISSLAQRLFIGMCFLHSDDSATIAIQDDGKTTHFIGKPNRLKSLYLYWKLLWHLLINAPKTGLLPIPLPGAIGLPGSSVHIGGSLPIEGKGPLSTTTDGQLTACPSVYIADAASLPDIPAGSYTLSLMANAYRIGKKVI